MKTVLHYFFQPLAIHSSMISLSNRQTPPIRIEGIFPSLDNLHIVIACNFKQFAISLVVIICAKIDSPVLSLAFGKFRPWQERTKNCISFRSLPVSRKSLNKPVSCNPTLRCWRIISQGSLSLRPACVSLFQLYNPFFQFIDLPVQTPYIKGFLQLRLTSRYRPNRMYLNSKPICLPDW